MAKVAYAQDLESNYEAVVILDEASGDSIEFQRALEVDAQDVSLGMNTYCLVRGGAAHYGGLLQWEVAGEQLSVTLTPEAARALELPESVTIQVGQEGARVLREHLGRLIS
jgi:hypothetical protein